MYRKFINDEYVYFEPSNKRVTDLDVLIRIKKLSIPPNWSDVIVSMSDTNYLQAYGRDAKQKIQYIYHPMWVSLAKAEKYNRLRIFNEKLPLIIKYVSLVLGRKPNKNGQIEVDKDYVVSVILKILGKTHSRIGNDYFADTNNTYGLTTLLKSHVHINGDTICISYIGKKALEQNYIFKDEQCSKAIRQLKLIPGERLFKTKDQEFVTSQDINKYVKCITGEDFTAKDFRTYGANYLFLKHILELPIEKNVSDNELRRKINTCYDKVAEELHHTRAVCKSSYVMSMISDKYSRNPALFKKTVKKLSDVFADIA
jgi:DNA topoisomerase-1